MEEEAIAVRPLVARPSTRPVAAALADDVGAGISPADGSFPGPDGGGCDAAALPLVAAGAPRDPSLLSPLCAAATSNVTDAASAATVSIPTTDLRMNSSRIWKVVPLGTYRNDNKLLGKT